MLLCPLTQREVQLVAIKRRLLGNENRVAHGVGQGVTCHRLKKCTSRAGLGRSATTAIPIAFQITAHNDWQNAIFLTQDAFDFPAFFVGISRQPLP